MGLELHKNQFGLRVYCTSCDRNFNEKSIVNCNHTDKQSYKSIVYYDNRTKVKHHGVKSYQDAILQAIQFKKDVLATYFGCQSNVLNGSSTGVSATWLV